MESCGLTCHSVPSGAAALEAIASQPVYDVIITDLSVPGVSGAELARRLRRPLLIAYSGRVDRAPYLDAQVEKPQVAELLKLVHAPRRSVAVVSVSEAECLGRSLETGLPCRASTPAHALRMFATAWDAGL